MLKFLSCSANLVLTYMCLFLKAWIVVINRLGTVFKAQPKEKSAQGRMAVVMRTILKNPNHPNVSNLRLLLLLSLSLSMALVYSGRLARYVANENPFVILGIPEDADRKMIKKAYRQLVKKHRRFID